MRKTRNRLDEMQEQKLLRIECRGCWFAFWALLASIFIQQFLFGAGDFKQIAGEWIVFMVLALYLSISCMRAGIWSRSFKPAFKTNLVTSFVAAVAAGTHVWAVACVQDDPCNPMPAANEPLIKSRRFIHSLYDWYFESVFSAWQI